MKKILMAIFLVGSALIAGCRKDMSVEYLSQTPDYTKSYTWKIHENPDKINIGLIKFLCSHCQMPISFCQLIDY